MHYEKILTTIVGVNQSSCLEVALGSDSQGEHTVELRRLSWGEGVGWYSQQTLRLDAKEAENLLQALRQSQFKWRTRPAGKQGKVIPFPLLPTSHEERRVHSLRNVQEKQSDNSASALPVGEKRRTKRGREKSITSHA
jgi:hypothetical protein